MPPLRTRRNQDSAAIPLTPRKPKWHAVTEAPFTRSMTNAKPAVLAIDIGNTGTRCELAALEANPELRVSFAVRVPNFNSLDTVGVGAADFPNQVNPFGDDDDWSIYHVAQGESTSIPLKELFYIDCLLCHLRDGRHAQIRQIIRQIPQLESFWKEYLKRDIEERDRVFRRLQDLFTVHIETIQDRCEAFAAEKDMRISRIVLTTPANWDSEMCESLTQLVTNAWKSNSIHSGSVGHISEFDAVAHWLVLDKPDSWPLSGQCREFLLADFGGHTLSLYRFTICLNEENNSFSFSAFRDGYTAHHGGSDCHAALVRDEVRIVLQNDKRRYTAEQREALLESAMRDYRSNKMAKVNGEPISLTASQGGDLGPIRIRLDAKKCKKFYDSMFGDLLEIFALRVEAAREVKGTRVLTVGGTFQNKHLLKKAEEIVHEVGLIWDETGDINIDPYFSSSIVAKGAALGTQTSMNARQFVDVSCFALNPGGLYEEEKLMIPIIMKKSSPMEAIVTVRLNTKNTLNGREKQEVDISCAPFKLEEQATHVYRPATYCVHTLLWEPADYKVRMTVVTEISDEEDAQPQDYLILFYVWVERKPDGSVEELESPHEVKLPIYFQAGQRLIQVDIDMMESDQKKTIHDKRVVLADDESECGSEEEDEDDGYGTCREIRDSVARGNWGCWESSIREKDFIATRRQAKNDRLENLNPTA